MSNKILVSALMVNIMGGLAQAAETDLGKTTIVEQVDDYAVSSTSTATKTDTPILLTPQSVQVVAEEVMRDQLTLNLTDAIRNVSSYASDFGFNGSTQPLLILRGFSMASQTAFGPMLGSSSYYLNGTKVSGVPVNMANVKAVEVVKGPSSVLYGRAEPGGLVNVVTKTAQAERNLSLEQTVGSFGTTRTLIEAGGALNDSNTLLSRVAASYTDEGSNRDFVVDRLKAVDASLAWVPSKATRVALTLDHTEQKYRNDYGVPAIGDRPLDLPWSRQYNDSPELSNNRTNTATLDIEQAVNDDWRIKVRGITLDSKFKEMDISPYRGDLVFGGDCLVNYGQQCRYYYYVRPDGKSRLDQGTVDLIGQFNTGAVAHELLVGVDSYFSRKTGDAYLDVATPVDLINPVLGNTAPANISPLTNMGQYQDRQRWTSVYVQDQVKLGHGVSVSAALRHDKTSAIYDLAGVEPNEDSFTTPRLGVVWEFIKNQSVYAQYQDSVSANNGRDPLTQAELAAERAKQIEVGYKASAFDGRLISTVAAYQLTKRNRADYSRWPLEVRVDGEGRSRGIELDVQGALTSKLAVMASYAYTDAKMTKNPNNDLNGLSGKTLANVPRNSGSVWLRYAMTKAWDVGGGVFAQGKRFGDTANTFVLPGYARVDAMTSYEFDIGRHAASVQANINNLLDKKYYPGAHQFVSDWIQVSKPRTYTATFRIAY